MRVMNRMAIAALALIGVFIATYMLFYSLGLVGTVVCGTSGGCEVVQNSRYAHFLGLPVAAWGLVGYFLMFLLALIGAQPRFRGERWVAAGLLGLTGIAFAFSVYLSALEQWVIGAWCRWCIASAILATLAFLMAIPEIGRLRRPPGRLRRPSGPASGPV